MTVIIHDASTDRKLIAAATWKRCPFCSHDVIRICATSSSTAFHCDNAACNANVYFMKPAAAAVDLWNQREESAER